MWIKLTRDINSKNQTAFFTDKNAELIFSEGDAFNCRINGEVIVNLKITYPYKKFTSGNSSVSLIEKLTPKLLDTQGNIYQIEFVEFDDNEINNFLSK